MPIIKKIPTGVADFDSIIKGGLPAGTVVLLSGDAGAGQNEFAYTSAAKLSMVKENPEMGEFLLGGEFKNTLIPENICYVTFSRSKEEILNEINTSFSSDYYKTFKQNILFQDFSTQYFKHSIVPSTWTSREPTIFGKGTMKEEGLLESLINFLDEKAPNSLVIIDSLTDLVISSAINMNELVTTLKGLQMISKQWNGLIYLILAGEVLDRRRREMLIDSVDGVLTFNWSKSTRSSLRQRYMYVEKFMSIFPHLDRSKIARFITTVSTQSGFVVLSREVIE